MTVVVKVPATSANIGPGFDCLGLALGLYNEAELEWSKRGSPESERDSVEVEGEGASDLPRDGSHLCLKAAARGLGELGLPVWPMRLRQRNQIPLSRGLGSSASAIVAGLAGVRALVGLESDPLWVLRIAADMEGHADNVAAAIYGGFTAAVTNDAGQAFCMDLHFPDHEVNVAVAVPAFRVSTEAARQILPQQIPVADASYSLARAIMLLTALWTRKPQLLEEATRDHIHTPYRSKLIPHYEDVQKAAMDKGALGVFISGSGPTVAAFTPIDPPDLADEVAKAMAAAFHRHGIEAMACVPGIDRSGVQVHH